MKYILFDLFGTLVDYSPSIHGNECSATTGLLNSVEICINESTFKDLWNECFCELEKQANIDNTEYDMLIPTELLLKKLGSNSLSSEFKKSLYITYMKDWIKGVIPIDGLHELLSTINLPKGIITNTHYQEMIPEILNQHGLSQYFEIIITSVALGKRKPSRDIFEHALNMIGHDANEVIYVGDNYKCDYWGPRQLGITGYLISEDLIDGVDERYRLSSIIELKSKLELNGR